MVPTTGVSAAPSPLQPAAPPAGAIAAAQQALSGGAAETPRPVTPASPIYFNPRYSFDRELSMMIMQIRDDVSGEVVSQFPSEMAVREYRRQQTHDTTVEATPESQGETPPSATAPVAASATAAPPTGVTVEI